METENPYQRIPQIFGGKWKGGPKAFRILRRTNGDRFSIQCLRTNAQFEAKKLTKKADIDLKVIQKTLKHPNIHRILQFFDYREQRLLVTEKCDEKSLREYLRIHRSFNSATTRFFVTQILRGVEYLHRNGITHRNLQLNSVLIQSSQIPQLVKISDYWFSVPLSECSNGYFGNEGICPPELSNGKVFGKPGDIWALGVLIYELLTGTHPFGGKNADFPIIYFPADLDAHVPQLIKEILRSDPLERPTIAQLMESPFLRGYRIKQLPPAFFQTFE